MVENYKFKVSKNKYYFTDADYLNLNYTIISYQDIQYHQQKNSLAKQKSDNAKIFFNSWHARF